MRATGKLVLLLASAWAVSASAITIDTVPIGNAGNANDPATGNLYGGVSYAYNIGKYEVTVGQYTAFLNSVAAADTYSLYDGNYSFDHTLGIARTGSPGSYSYSVIGSPNRPVIYVTWGDATRFANWLHNGQPTGVQGPGTTETGAYALNGAVSDVDLMAVERNAGATWFIPTENEWYKAAYYQPVGQGGDTDNYWEYPMKTNRVPYSDQPPGATPDNTRVGNFFKYDAMAPFYDDGYAVTGQIGGCIIQNCLTDVGAYSSSPSFYGTFDQGGNVKGWNEAAVSSTSRGQRGGQWADFYFQLWASNRGGDRVPKDSSNNTGFRVATIIPEPSSALLAVSIVALLAGRRSRR